MLRFLGPQRVRHNWAIENAHKLTSCDMKQSAVLGMTRTNEAPFLVLRTLNIHWKDWCWSWNSNTLVTRCEELTHWKRPWCWEKLKVGGEGEYTYSIEKIYIKELKRDEVRFCVYKATRRGWGATFLIIFLVESLSYVQRFCDPMDCSPPGSSVHGISQARILKWVVISFSRGSSPPRDGTQVSCISCIGRQILYHWATRVWLFRFVF